MPDSAAPSPSTFSASDRLLARAHRALTARPYLLASLALHALGAGGLALLAGLGESERAVANARAAVIASQEVADTQARELAHRVERMEEIRRQLDEAAGRPAPPRDAPPTAAVDRSPAALAVRARQLAEAIDASERQLRAATLARLTGQSVDDAVRRLEAEARTEAARQAAATPGAAASGPESAREAIERLERQAQAQWQARRLQVAAARDGVRVQRAPASAPSSAAASAAAPAASPPAGPTLVTSVARPAASRPASEPAVPPKAADPTARAASQRWVADGIPTSLKDQMRSIVHGGEPSGRVGVAGVQGGRSVNQRNVMGVEGGVIHTASEPYSWVPIDPGPPIAATGGSLDLSAPDAQGRRTTAGYRAAPGIDAATLRTGAGRTLGPGGAHATRVYLDSWYVIGPFAATGEDPLKTVHPPEEEVDLDGVYRGAGGRLLRWRYESRGFYPFVPSEPATNAVYYAYTELRVDEDRDLWVDIGADDDSMLWIDGRLVWVSAPADKPGTTPYYFRDEQVASLALVEGHRRVHLARGLHRVLVKLVNGDERTFFSVVLAP